MPKLYVIVFSFCVLPILSGCNSPSATSNNANDTDDAQKISAVASFSPLAALTEKIAGDNTNVTNLSGNSGVHEFSPGPRDIITLQEADLVVLVGSGLEPWGDDIRSLDRTSTKTLILEEHLDLIAFEDKSHEDDEHDHEDDHNHDEQDHEHDEEEHMHDDEAEHEDEEDHEHSNDESHDEDEHSHEHDDEHDHDDHDHGHGHDHDHGEFDPHFWLDPVFAQAAAVEISATLTEINPEQSELYVANTKTLLDELGAIAEEYEAGLANCQRDTVIGSHDFLGYLEQRYDFTVLPIAGASHLDEPSAQNLAQLQQAVGEYDVSHILVEQNSVQRFADTIATETGLNTVTITALETGETEYFTGLRQNLASLQTALECR